MQLYIFQMIKSTHINANIKKEDIEICFFDGEQVKHYDVDEYDIIFKDFLAIENDIASLSNEIITIKGKNETV